MEEVRLVEYGPSPGRVVVVTVTSSSQHTSLGNFPDLQAAVTAGKPLMLSADSQSVVYTWAPTTASMTVITGVPTGASMGSATQAGAFLAGRTPIPEIPPQGTVGLVAVAPSGTTNLRIWWGQ